jgi:hypothetical protein
MAINYLNNVDFNRNELQNAQLIKSQVENQPNDAAVGGTPVEGQLYFNTTSDVLKVYGNGSWSEVGGGVETLTTTDGTYIDLTPNSATAGAVTVTADLSAVDGTAVAATRFLSKDNTWDVPVFDNYDYWVLDADGNGATANIGPGDTADFVGGLKIGTNSTVSGVLNITHDLQSQTNTTSAASPTDGATFTVIDSVTVDSTGHIGGKNLKTITLPTFPTIPTVSDATITLAAGSILNGGGAFTLNQSANETITFNLDTGGIGAGTYGSTNDSIKVDNITVDAYGRVTAITTGATGQVNTVVSGNTSTLTATGTINKTLTAVTGAVNASSANLATGAQIQTAIDTALTGVLKFQGVWNASTNSPTLTSSVGTSGDYYIVSVAGSTNLNGITDWEIGDWAVFANTTWTKIDNSQVGNVTGDGTAGRVSFWNSASNITSDSGFTYNATSNALGVSGIITASGGNSSEWNSGYDNMITALNVSGTTTKTLTATQQDGGTLTASWTDNDSGGTVTNIATSGPITGGPITSTGTIGITTASAGTIGAGAVAAGTGISVAYASGIATVTNTQTNSANTYAGTITDSVSGTTFNHGLGEDVIVQLYDATNKDTVYADVVRNGNYLNISFSSTPINSIRVLVQKIG